MNEEYEAAIAVAFQSQKPKSLDVVIEIGVGEVDLRNTRRGATWDSDGRIILLAFSKSSTLGSIHFASKPPSLVLEQWVLLHVPSLVSLSYAFP
ncbi:hypothetical protein JHK87_001084 [Glycine soja]|nr:hypothetical protein JHK87_001084 [Glycine soja]